MPRKIDIPESLADLVRDPSSVRDGFELLNAIAEINVRLVTPGGSEPLESGRSQIRGEAPDLILPLPLKLPSAIADSTASAASVSAQLNALLAGLRATGMLPT